MKQLAESLLADLAYTFRTLLANPGFAALTCLSIAIGIAANTTVFSIANALLLGELPVKDPGRLVSLSNTVHGGTFTYGDYKDFAALTRAFEGVAANYPAVAANISGNSGVPERVWGQLVTGNYFDVIGSVPNPGRGFRPSEDQQSGSAPVVVLTHSLWQRRYAGDPSIAGKTVLLDGRPFTVVGVAARGFYGTQRGLMPDFFVPLSAGRALTKILSGDILENRHAQWLSIDARLRKGVTLTQARAALNIVNSRIDREFRKGEPESRIRLMKAGGLPGAGSLVIGRVILGVMVGVSLVLLIACANVANVLLARMSARQGEIAMRMALGANRRRLIRQLLTESVTLALFGAALGLFFTSFASDALAKLELPLPVTLTFDFGIDRRVLLYTTALAVATGIAFGLLPALRTTRVDLIRAMHSRNVTSGVFRRLSLRNSLVVVQVTASLVLLVSAGLFLRSLQNAMSLDTGMNANGVMAMAIDPSLNGYGPEKSRRLMQSLRDRVLSVPGVEAMSFTDVLPLSFGGMTIGFSKVSSTSPKNQEIEADVFDVGANYFRTLHIPLLHGEDFGSERQSTEKVALINGAMAKKMFAKADPIGSYLTEGKNRYRVIGVAANQKSRFITEDFRPCVYRSLMQVEPVADDFFGTTLLIRFSGDPKGLADAIRNQIRALDPNIPVFNIESLPRHVSKALLLPRLGGMLFGIFGAAGLLLAAVGLYGVVSYTVRQRTKEIGIRMALGAQRRSVLQLLSSQGMALAGVGVVIGLAISLAAGRVASALLYGVSPTDPLTFSVVPVILLVVAGIAVVVPAFRAATADPVKALRDE
jgi:predicted permease